MDPERLEAFRFKHSNTYLAFKKRYIIPELTFEKVMIHVTGRIDDPELIKAVSHKGSDLFEEALHR